MNSDRYAGQLLPWPQNPGVDLEMIDHGDLNMLHHVMCDWPPNNLHYLAGALRLTRHAPETGYNDRWDSEDLKILETLAQCPPWDDPVSHASGRPWRIPPHGISGSYLAWSMARATVALPELLADEIERRGLRGLDARRRQIRDIAAGLSQSSIVKWRAVDVPAFIGRRLPFHPLTAATVSHWLAGELSTGNPGTGHHRPTPARE